jgi:hypothetical protein
MQSVHPKKINEMQSYKEIWKDVPEYEGVYQVSSLGRVKSLKFGKEKLLKPGTDRGKYHLVVLSKNKIKTALKVHRLVMVAFVGKSDLQVNHKNGIKSDNRLENLEYCTQSENIQHSYDIGVRSKGENHWKSKLTRACVERIKYGHQGMTQKDIAKIYGINQQQVSAIRSGKNWNHI